MSATKNPPKAKKKKTVHTNGKKMLVNMVEPEEVRIAVVSGQRLQEIYIERKDDDFAVGNIYMGKVVNVEPALGAAFIDIGAERNAFLHVSDVQPAMQSSQGQAKKKKTARSGEKGHKSERLPKNTRIEKVLKKGQLIPVQITRTAIDRKGASVTTFLSIAGRHLVLMSDSQKVGVSRKIQDEKERERLKGFLRDLVPPEGLGFIIRTSGVGRNKADLKRDLTFVTRLWKQSQTAIKKAKDVGMIYEESDLVVRACRDIFSADIAEILCDSQEAHKRARDFMAMALPAAKRKVKFYQGSIPLFIKHKVEDKVQAIFRKRVDLPSKAYLVIEQTEALVSIDVNSGKSSSTGHDPEALALKINLEAAEVIAHQLRLRDLGGLIVCDFIDMSKRANRQKVEKALQTQVKEDRARTVVGGISSFGLLEMSRQRMRTSLERAVFEACSHCEGTGKSPRLETVVLRVLRQIRQMLAEKRVDRIEMMLSMQVSQYIQNRKRSKLVELEESSGKSIEIKANPDFSMDERQVTLYNPAGSVVTV